MPLLEWKADMSVGIDSIDLEHQQLLAILNSLYDNVQAGKGHDVLEKTLDDLVSYTSVHFQNEEGYFEKTGYPHMAEHKAEHAALIKQVKEIQEKIKTDQSATMSIDVMSFLKNWLYDHIKGSDKSYSDHLISNGIR